MKDQLIKLIESIDTENVLTEDQKKALEAFGESIATKLNEEREAGYTEGFEKSKEIAEKYVEDYDTEVDAKLKELVEATDELITKREKLAVVENADSMNEGMVEKLSDYLDTYITDVMPESVVVDYKKLQRLEKMTESLKELIIISEEEVHERAERVAESMESKNAEIGEELSTKTEQLQKEMEKRIAVESELKALKAKNLLNEKLKDVPELEAKKLEKHFEESSVEEIEESFEEVYENVRYGFKNESKKSMKIDNDKIKSIMEEYDETDDSEEEEKEEDVNESIAHYAQITTKSYK